MDDEFFRVYVTMGAEPGTKLWRLWSDKVVGSSFARSPALRARLNQDHTEFARVNQNAPIRLADGSYVPDSLRHLVQPLSAKRINSVVEKIVRCLHFHNYHERLPVETSVMIATAPLAEEEAYMLKNHPTGSVGIDKEFRYYTVPLGDGMGWWVLSFYDKQSFSVLTTLPTSDRYYPRRNY